jgi:hypothetical protein
VSGLAKRREATYEDLVALPDDVVRAEPFDAIGLTLTGLWIRAA